MSLVPDHPFGVGSVRSNEINVENHDCIEKQVENKIRALLGGFSQAKGLDECLEGLLGHLLGEAVSNEYC